MACLDQKGKSQMINAENQSSKLSILMQSRKKQRVDEYAQYIFFGKVIS